MIGDDEGRGALLQHYFDERGVARIYEMPIAIGQIEAICRYPVKSMRGEPLDAVAIPAAYHPTC